MGNGDSLSKHGKLSEETFGQLRGVGHAGRCSNCHLEESVSVSSLGRNSEGFEMAGGNEAIWALVPRDRSGCQFVCYADSCSGVEGALHERNFAEVNAVVASLRPQPEFICFPGDEIRGLTADPESLRRQWDYWFRHEMAWLDRKVIPLYHTASIRLAAFNCRRNPASQP